MSSSKLEFRTYVASLAHRGITQVQQDVLDLPWRQLKWDHQALGILALTLVVLTFPTSVPKMANARSWMTLNVALGHVGHFELGDGRTLDLNTDSEAHFFTTPRETYLVLNRGEVLVDGHGTTAIQVVSNGTAVVATDAAFSVRRRDAVRTDILVKRGAARVEKIKEIADITSPPQLLAGQAASVLGEDLSGLQKFSPVVVMHKLAWTDGWLWFSDETLSEAVERFNSYNSNRHLVVSDPRLGQITIGGRFRPTETASFVSTLQHVFALTATTVRSGSGDSQTVYLHPAKN